MQKSKINLRDAKQGMQLAEPVYVTIGADGAPMLAAGEGTKLDENLINRLEMYNVHTVEVFLKTTPKPVSSNIIAPTQVVPAKEKKVVGTKVSIRPDLPTETIAPIEPSIGEELKEEAINSVQELFTCFDAAQGGVINKTTAYQCVSNVERVVGDLVDILSNDTGGLVHINGLKSFDEYTYHHSLSVAMLSMATGRELGFNEDDIFRIGRCAMMHDIGKQMIPLDIINKKGKLTDREFENIKCHTVLGANTLKTNDIGDAELWDGVMYHHEKVNGLGYPKGLKGKDIPLFSKIIAVADAYDATTSFRAYRAPLLPSEAFEVIRKDIGTSFDYTVVKAFFEKLEIYPVNTIVELSDGRMGIVVDDDSFPNRRLRPTVRIWGTTQIEYLAAPVNMDIDIVGVFRAEDFASEG